VYVVYDGFKPSQGEVPFLMFDAGMVERFRGPARVQAGRPHEGHAQNGPVAELEDEEYAEIKSQLAQLRADHPFLPASAPRGSSTSSRHRSSPATTRSSLPPLRA
jgi:hypothetical protein